MPLDCTNVNANASIYQEVRDLLAMGLTGSELKTALAYLVEKDEATRQVRGKTQEQVRTVAGLSRTRFMEATASLKKRGLIAVQKHRNGPATIDVGRPGNADVPKAGRPGFETSRKLDTGRPENRDLGRPGNVDNVIYAAPVIDSITAPECAREPSANDLAWQQAMQLGEQIKGGKVAKSARSLAATQGELDGSRGITFDDSGKLSVVNGTAAELSREFPGITLENLCSRAAPELAKYRHPTYTQAMTVLRKWGHLLAGDKAKTKRKMFRRPF